MQQQGMQQNTMQSASMPNMNSGYQIPPRTQAMPQNTQPMSSPAMGTSGYGAPSGSGFPNTAYQSPNAGSMQPSAYPSRPQAPTGYVPTANGTQPNQTQPYQTQPYGPSTQTYPNQSMYPGGQVPTGLIGQSGHATAPTGDFAPPTPVMGTMGVGTSTPTSSGYTGAATQVGTMPAYRP